MGTDLRLLPLDHLSDFGDRVWGYSHTVLRLPRNSDAWPAFVALGEPVPENSDISSYVGKRVPDGTSKGELMYGKLTKDAYGEPYKWVRAQDLRATLLEWFQGNPVTDYVMALRHDTRIILDWH